MKLKFPQTVQAWFNAINVGARRNVQAEKSGDPVNLSGNAQSVVSPAIFEAIQDLCYEIFALPICTLEAVRVAETICRHIYDFAQSTNPSLQQLVMDLIPTLLHVYLVMTSSFSNVVSHTLDSTRVQAQTGTVTAVSTVRPLLTPKKVSIQGRKSLRERLKKPSSATAMASQFRRPSVGSGINKTVRDKTRKILAGLNPNAESVNISDAQEKDAVERNMAVLSATLGALMLGLHNSYVKQKRFQAPVLRAFPPFPGGSVFSDHLPAPEGQGGDPSVGNPSTDVGLASFVELKEISTGNQWQILRFLCRISTAHVCDLTERSREAFCLLGLLLSPTGLQRYSIPERMLCVGSTKSNPEGARWKNFRRRCDRLSTPNRLASISSITAPLRTTAIRRANRSNDARKEEVLTNLDFQDPGIGSIEGAIDEPLVQEEKGDDEDDDDEDDLEASCSAVSGSCTSPEELGSNVSLCSDDEIATLHEEGVVQPQQLPNNDHLLPTANREDVYENTHSWVLSGEDDDDEDDDEVEAEDDDVVTANSRLGSTGTVVNPTALPPVALPLTPPSKSADSVKWSLQTVSAKHDAIYRLHKKTTLAGQRMARIPNISSQFVVDLLPCLHYLLDTPQASEAARAVTALNERATMELWSNVLLYINGISNSKLFGDAVSSSKLRKQTGTRETGCVLPDQMNQSNVTTLTVPCEPTPASHNPVRPFSLSSSEEEHLAAAWLNAVRQPCVTAITNASFHAVRPEEDIPLAGVGSTGPRSLDGLLWKPATTSPSPKQSRAKSVSPFASPALPSTSEVAFTLPDAVPDASSPVTDSPVRQRTQSFNFCSKRQNKLNNTSPRVKFVDASKSSLASPPSPRESSSLFQTLQIPSVN